jgi:hypothetical protein
VTPLGSAIPSRAQNVDAEAALQRDVRAKHVDARGRGEEEQVAVLMEVDRVSDFVGEPLQHADRFDREPDVGFVGKLMPDAARVAAGRSRAEQLLALDEDDVGDAAARQMIGHAGAHAAAADDHNFSGPLHDFIRRDWGLGIWD